MRKDSTMGKIGLGFSFIIGVSVANFVTLYFVVKIVKWAWGGVE